MDDGSKLSGMDLYDSCIVVLNVRGATVSIPSARVLTDKPPQQGPSRGVEFGMERFSPARGTPRGTPKGGGPNGEENISWWYWIPCGHDVWLQMHTTDMKILGKRTASVLRDQQVTES